MNENYQLAKAIMFIYLSEASQVATYKWDGDFKIEQMESLSERIKERDGYKDIEISNMSKTQLESLGFSCWDESGLMLIPLWIFDFLPEELNLSCISGESMTIKKSEIDKDVRFGCLAYGVIPCEV